MCAGSSKAGDRSHLGRIDELEYDGPGDVFMISYDLLFSFRVRSSSGVLHRSLARNDINESTSNTCSRTLFYHELLLW